MRRLLFAWALLLAGLYCIKQSSADWQSRDSNYNVAISGGAAASFTLAGYANQNNASSNTNNYTINLGTAASNRLVVVAANYNSTAAATATITANGVLLNKDVLANDIGNSQTASVWSGVVSSGSGSQTITLAATAGLQFSQIAIVVWIGYNLSSTLVKQTGAQTTQNTGISNMNVTAGDFLVSVTSLFNNNISAFVNTDTPTDIYGNSQTGGVLGENNLIAADNIPAITTSSSYVIYGPGSGGSSNAVAAATYK